MVGIRDIAKEANVSISTVSYALNGSARVSEGTRERILAIANEMNYIPNLAGQNLRRQKTDIIAVYLASYQGTFYGELLEGMHQKAVELGLELIVCSGKRSRLFLPQRLIDGILVLDVTYEKEELLKYADLGYPIVVLDRQLTHEHIRSVLLDNKAGSKKAVQSLVDEGIDKLYIISGPVLNHDSSERAEAAVEVAKASNIECEIIEGDFTEASGYSAGEKMDLEQDLKYGIFALNDEMALGIHNYMIEKAYHVGKDILIRGFDKNQVTEYLVPPVKSVSYSKHKWGAMAVESLQKMIKKEEVENKIVATRFEN
ncbi:LacI family DNA-binding transcriptional regulator [Alkalibacterium sp. 20]|uniref:LacI family DNA-binding transcriptional regulator n=1 Tax=Alkalibacterium sp. 20 TaxID=1798803 RepID=UPI0009002A7C|nr:LacI family DNA-binding transcriptional regulator [Alkalibacterium sp. 20]OJF93806.1 LacI family transcriptional regulator [Alkalibacterium sp. 20]